MFKHFINFNDIPAAFFNYYGIDIPFNIEQSLYTALHKYDRETLFKKIDEYTVYNSSNLTQYTTTEIIKQYITNNELLVTLNIHNFNYTGDFKTNFDTLLANFINVFDNVKIVFLRDTESFLISSFIDSILNNEIYRHVHTPEIIKWRKNMTQKNITTSKSIIDSGAPYILLNDLFYKDTRMNVLHLCKFLDTKPSQEILTYKVSHPTDINCITNLQNLKSQLLNTDLSTCLQ